MHTYAEKPRISQTKAKKPGEGTFQFTDQRPETAALNRLQALAAASPQSAQLRAIQGKTQASQRTAENEEELQAQAAGIPQAATDRQPEAAPRPNRTGLPDNLKTGMESLSGISMDNVRVHYNSDKPAQLNAHAYAQGADIHVAPGQEKHLAHEAWHVVQQAQGRVKPTIQLKGGVPVNDDAALEREADDMGAKLASGGMRAKFEPSHTREVKFNTKLVQRVDNIDITLALAQRGIDLSLKKDIISALTILYQKPLEKISSEEMNAYLDRYHDESNTHVTTVGDLGLDQSAQYAENGMDVTGTAYEYVADEAKLLRSRKVKVKKGDLKKIKEHTIEDVKSEEQWRNVNKDDVMEINHSIETLEETKQEYHFGVDIKKLDSYQQIKRHQRRKRNRGVLAARGLWTKGMPSNPQARKEATELHDNLFSQGKNGYGRVSVAATWNDASGGKSAHRTAVNLDKNAKKHKLYIYGKAKFPEDVKRHKTQSSSEGYKGTSVVFKFGNFSKLFPLLISLADNINTNEENREALVTDFLNEVKISILNSRFPRSLRKKILDVQSKSSGKSPLIEPALMIAELITSYEANIPDEDFDPEIISEYDDSELSDDDFKFEKKPKREIKFPLDLEEESLLQELVKVNNCLINSIAEAGLNRNATFEELVEIRSIMRERGFPIGAMLVASPAILNIIRNVLGINRGIIVYYSNSRIVDSIQGPGNIIQIWHVNGNHFTSQQPHDWIAKD